MLKSLDERLRSTRSNRSLVHRQTFYVFLSTGAIAGRRQSKHSVRYQQVLSELMEYPQQPRRSHRLSVRRVARSPTPRRRHRADRQRVLARTRLRAVDRRLELLGSQRRLLWCVSEGGTSSRTPFTTETVGGDDLRMKGWDIRQGGAQPLFVNKRCDTWFWSAEPR